MDQSSIKYRLDREPHANLSGIKGGAAQRRASALPDNPDPLTFWRRLPVRDFEPNHVESLRDCLAEFFLSHGLAYAGDHEDPASAVGAAIAVLTAEDSSDELAEDVVMSRLLCSALRGDRACAWILAGVLDRRSRTDACCHGMSEGWRRLAKAPCQRECKPA
jgi:hypothetical protein